MTAADKRWVDLGAHAVWTVLGCTKPEEYVACEATARAVLDIVNPIRDEQLRAELEPPIDRVRRLHSQGDDAVLAPGKWCPACGHETPCPTIRALNGDRS